jgi:hypothetical protein
MADFLEQRPGQRELTCAGLSIRCVNLELVFSNAWTPRASREDCERTCQLGDPRAIAIFSGCAVVRR